MNIDITHLKAQKLLVAISGGIDSVVLAHLLHHNGVDIVLAHCNFQLRGEESDADEAFVRAFARELQVPLEVIRFDTKTYAHTHKLNTQLAARKLRYDWFEKLLTQQACDKVAIAHNANDNLETFFINLSRGTGLNGLIGIPEQTATIIRPLLKVSRAEIVEYAQKHRLSWREDSSNATDHYVRNRIRHHISPLLTQIHPNFLENFQKTQEYLYQSAEFIDFYIQKIRENAFQGENPIRIATQKLQEVPQLELVLHKLFYPYGFGNVKDLKNLLLKAEAGKQLVSGTHILVKDKDCLWLKSLEQEEEKPKLLIQEVTPPFAIKKNTPNIAYFDADKLTAASLFLRKKAEGDAFYPLGFGRKKKLSKFFIDEKYTQAQREAQWLLCCEKDIVWVVGKRMDERFKITEQTQKALRIEVIGSVFERESVRFI